MSKFYRNCFHTQILADEVMTSIMRDLCVEPDEAEQGDFLAVEFPFITLDGQMDSPGFPCCALVADREGIARRLPWFTLIKNGLDERRTKLFAEAVSRISRFWCLDLSEQMARMSNNSQEAHRYDLMLGAGTGALVRNFEDADHEGMQEDSYDTDDKIQAYIDAHSAIALPPYDSSHERLLHADAATKGSAIADLTSTLSHPTTYMPIYPAPRV